MANTFTANLYLEQPEIGAAENTWGQVLNDDLDLLDDMLGTTTVITETSGTVQIRRDYDGGMGSGDYSRNTFCFKVNASGGNLDLDFETGLGGFWLIRNESAGNTVTALVTAQTGVVIPPGTTRLVYYDSTATDIAFFGGLGATSGTANYIPQFNSVGDLVDSELLENGTALYPDANDGLALGISNTGEYSDLFLASGAVIGFANNDVNITHAANTLNFNGATNGYCFDEPIKLPTDKAILWGPDVTYSINADIGDTRIEIYANANPATDGIYYLTATSISPHVTDSASLGTSALNWSDLFLDLGGVINFDSGDVTITHFANQLCFTDATGGYQFEDGFLLLTTPNGSNSMSFTNTTSGAIGLLGNDGTAGEFRVGADFLDTVAASKVIISVDGTDRIDVTDLAIIPSTDDAMELGNSTNGWTNVYVASDGVIDFEDGDCLISHDTTADELLFIGMTTYDFDTSINVGVNFTLAGYTVGAISNDTALAGSSATDLVTENAVKTYVDTQVTAQDLDIATDSGTIAIDLDGETLTIAGGTGLDTSAATNTVTIAIDSTVATLTGSQTLTNKTLTAPIISTISNTGTLTLPTATTTLVGRDTTDTLTSKTINSASNTITIDLGTASVTGSVAEFNAALELDDFCTLTGAETLTNKTLTSPTINSGVLDLPQINDATDTHQYVFAVSELAANRTVTLPLLTSGDTFVFNNFGAVLQNKTIDSANNTLTLDLSEGTLEGTFSEFNAAVSDATLVSLTGSEVLTNKTLTAPVINGAVTGTLTVSQTFGPTSDAGADLGTSTVGWGDLHLASGGVINFNNGDQTVIEEDVEMTKATNARTHNFVVNAGMMISQVNWESAVTGSDTYPVDQWKQEHSLTSGTVSIEQRNNQDILDIWDNDIRMTATTGANSSGSTNYIAISQPIEGQFSCKLVDMGQATAKDINIGMVVRASKTGTFCVSIRNSAEDRSYVTELTIDTADTHEWKSFTIPGDTTGTWSAGASHGMTLSVCMHAGTSFDATADTWTAGNKISTTNQTDFMSTTSDTFDLTCVVMVPEFVNLPSQAYAPYCMKSKGEEFARSRRYYCNSVNGSDTPTGSRCFIDGTDDNKRHFHVWYGVEMRAADQTFTSTLTNGNNKQYTNKSRIGARFQADGNPLNTTVTTSYTAWAHNARY